MPDDAPDVPAAPQAVAGAVPAADGGGGDDHWFASARFGLFIHWGMYSNKGLEPSWPLVGGFPAFPFGQKLNPTEYYDGAESWVPPEGAPREWIRAAKACGMRYAVLTTKHHDGFALFDSPHSDFGVSRNAPGRDLVREYVDACRAEGLRVGFYFSLSDWHHPDYPAFTESMQPYPFITYPRAEPEQWARFLADLRGQLDHLLTDYGEIATLWFDGGWERSAGEWQARELEAFIRERQPGIVINDRLPGVKDYESPEQSLPVEPIDGWWEMCLTMNHSWGPVAADHSYKSVRYLLSILAEVAAGGGNLLLNVSPDGEGHLLDWQRERLEGIAAWMDRHSAAIFDTGPGLEPGHFYGPSTRRGSTLYLLCPMRPVEVVTVRSIPGRTIESIRALGTGTELKFELRLTALDRILGSGDLCDVVIRVPDEACDDLMTVFEVTYASS